jgi:hypothetical protein
MKRQRQSEDVFGDEDSRLSPKAAATAAAEFEAPPVAEMDETRVVRPVKAYKNQDFLLSHGARTIRIMAEHQETLDRLEANGVKDFVLVRSHSSDCDRAPSPHRPSCRSAVHGPRSTVRGPRATSPRS